MPTLAEIMPAGEALAEEVAARILSRIPPREPFSRTPSGESKAFERVRRRRQAESVSPPEAGAGFHSSPEASQPASVVPPSSDGETKALEELRAEHGGIIRTSETGVATLFGAKIDGQSGQIWFSNGKPVFANARGSFELIVAPKIRATPFTLRDPATIPRREFLFLSHYVRRYLTATFGAGGGGKSALAVTEALAMSTARHLLGVPPKEPATVWYVNVEDPAIEIERRFAGAAKNFRITEEHIGGRLFTDSGRDQEFVIVKSDGRNVRVCEPVVASLIEEIKARAIDVLIIDPFVSTHEVEENDNTRIQQVAAQWVRVAEEGNCSVELIHHVAKGHIEVTADSGRGAGALKDKARSVRVINAMTAEQAEAAGVPLAEAWSYFRVDFGKANLTKRSGIPAWRRFQSVKLGNGGAGNMSMLRGDEIGVVVPWEWPTAEATIQDVTDEARDCIVQRLGFADYRKDPQTAAWAGNVVSEVLGWPRETKAEKKRISDLLQVWIEEGRLHVVSKPDAKRTPRPFIVPAAAPPP
jgi:hypothetical protein